MQDTERSRGKLWTLSVLTGRCPYEMHKDLPVEWDFIRIEGRKVGVHFRLHSRWVSIYYL